MGHEYRSACLQCYSVAGQANSSLLRLLQTTTGNAPIIQQKTGLIVDAYFSATKLNGYWIMCQVQEKKRQKVTLAFGTVDCWLIWKLPRAKIHITDVPMHREPCSQYSTPANGMRTCSNFLTIPASVLPEVRSSSKVYGETAEQYYSTQIFRSPVSRVINRQHYLGNLHTTRNGEEYLWYRLFYVDEYRR